MSFYEISKNTLKEPARYQAVYEATDDKVELLKTLSTIGSEKKWLIDIIDICMLLEISAKLFSETGEELGRVEKNGSYQLFESGESHATDTPRNTGESKI